MIETDYVVEVTQEDYKFYSDIIQEITERVIACRNSEEYN